MPSWCTLSLYDVIGITCHVHIKLKSFSSIAQTGCSFLYIIAKKAVIMSETFLVDVSINIAEWIRRTVTVLRVRGLNSSKAPFWSFFLFVSSHIYTEGYSESTEPIDTVNILSLARFEPTTSATPPSTTPDINATNCATEPSPKKGCSGSADIDDD